MKKNIKKYMLATFSLLFAFGLVGCSKEETKNVLVCDAKDEYNTNNGLEYVLADDGKTIDKFIIKEGVTPAFMEKWFPDKNKDELFNDYIIQYQNMYSTVMDGNESISWLNASLDISEDKQEILFIVAFDFTDENFELNDDTYAYLNQFGINDYYNEDEKRFEVVSKQVETNSQNSWLKLECEVKEIEK